MSKPWLTVSKNTEGPRFIVDEAGRPVRLFGMARSQICAPWDEDIPYGGIDGVCAHFKGLGCNTIRLAVSVFDQEHMETDFIEECGGYNEEGINRFIDRHVEPDLRRILAHDLYVVLDLHEYPPNDDHDDPDPALLIAYARAHYVPIWRELAKRYRDEPGVAMYELWNEPYAADQGTIRFNEGGIIKEGRYTGYDWNGAVRRFFIDCAAEVRRFDTRHILLVSDWNAGWGCGWGLTWGGKYRHAADPLYKNLVFSVHAGGGQLREAILFGEGDNFCFDDYWAELAAENNIALQFGEIEAEEAWDSDHLGTFVRMLEKRADTHHYPAMLWRPRGNARNRVELWTDFAARYATR